MFAVDESSNDHGKDEDKQHVAAQGIIEKMIPHRAIREKWDHIVKTPKRPLGQRDETHHPETQVCYQGYVVPNSRAQITTSMTSAGT
jgi:hypothetical protein